MLETAANSFSNRTFQHHQNTKLNTKNQTMSTVLATAISADLRPNLVPDTKINARERIPDDVFPTVLGWVPISTVDFVPTRVVDGTRQFMLGLRTEAPFQDTWFVAGGRKNWGERTRNALKRQVNRELGLDIDAPGVTAVFRGIVDVLNPECSGADAGARPEWHSNWLFHEIELADGIEPVAKAENRAVKWFTHILPEFPEPVQEALALLGFEHQQ